MVGLKPKFDDALENIKTQLSQSEEKDEVIKMEKLKKDYIVTFASEINFGSILKEIELVAGPDEIRLHGKQRHLKEG